MGSGGPGPRLPTDSTHKVGAGWLMVVQTHRPNLVLFWNLKFDLLMVDVSVQFPSSANRHHNSWAAAGAVTCDCGVSETNPMRHHRHGRTAPAAPRPRWDRYGNSGRQASAPRITASASCFLGEHLSIMGDVGNAAIRPRPRTDRVVAAACRFEGIGDWESVRTDGLEPTGGAHMDLTPFPGFGEDIRTSSPGF